MYQVYANGQKYWEPQRSKLGAMAVYMAALDDYGNAEIKLITKDEDSGESKCTFQIEKAQ